MHARRLEGARRETEVATGAVLLSEYCERDLCRVYAPMTGISTSIPVDQAHEQGHQNDTQIERETPVLLVVRVAFDSLGILRLTVR